jgi:hypothetical protein
MLRFQPSHRNQFHFLGAAGPLNLILFNFQPSFDCLTDIGQYFLPGFALRPATPQRGNMRDEAGIFSWFNYNFQNHWRSPFG